MTTLKFIKKKNKILKKLTGLTLIPKDQLTDVTAVKMEVGNDAFICPYCVLYSDDYQRCDGCPMAEKGNKCGVDTDNTYRAVSDSVKNLGHRSIGDVPDIRKLVKKFNKQFK